jgi:hypothetical protein
VICPNPFFCQFSRRGLIINDEELKEGFGEGKSFGSSRFVWCELIALEWRVRGKTERRVVSINQPSFTLTINPRLFNFISFFISFFYLFIKPKSKTELDADNDMTRRALLSAIVS